MSSPFSFLFWRRQVSYLSNLRSTTLASVTQMSFEDRDNFIRTHKYSKQNSNTMTLNCHDMNREQTLTKYYPHYTIDNLYEYCLVRNLITLLNKYGNMKGKRAFTLGHYKPLNRGGAHHISNWVIQSARDNQKQGDKLPENPVKWSYTEQVNYIMSKIDYFLVDDSVLEDLQFYILMFGKVYINEKK
ncbi:hypothetical protein [Yersinia phage vB_YenM_P778]